MLHILLLFDSIDNLNRSFDCLFSSIVCYHKYLFEHDIVEYFVGASGVEDRDRFRDAAGWLLFAGIAGIISQIKIW